jgi:hypothetical protein
MWGYPEFYIPVPGGYDAWSTPPWERGRTGPSEAPPIVPRPLPEGA